MKFLLDVHFSPRLVQQLRDQGADVEHASERGQSTTADEELWRSAVAEDRVMVTYNRKDFLLIYEQFWHSGFQHPGLIIFNHATFNQKDLGSQLRALLEIREERGDLTDQVVFLAPGRSS